MSDEEYINPISFQNVVLPAAGMIIASVVAFLLFEHYWWAFIFGLCAIATILYRLLALTWIETKVRRYVAYAIYLLAFIGTFLLADEVGDYFNQRAIVQSHCGNVQNIDERHSERNLDTFDLVNNEKEVKFLYKYYKDELQQHQHKVCIDYSFDERWARYPYIHHIKPYS